MLAALLVLIGLNFALSIWARKYVEPDTPIPVAWSETGMPERFAPARTALFYLPVGSCVVLPVHLFTPGGTNAFPLSLGILVVLIIGNWIVVRSALGHPPRLSLYVITIACVLLCACALQFAFLHHLG
ncbi:hypothetical protein IFT84_01445 [Rhizobium sp. CFBP 8762]|uniref:hypothetical protein n=1 Tax=Rhizobium sp. CFBP 8762 TaxID=2775279 RepID=UPI0017829269|nr:hypothetical protein [Rhizobium sp. CFBP 8762]MBD8553181.1 hypothetical protein [Rhizobium sp. CFBP 8762]